MRALRTLAGLVLVLIGVPALIGGVAGAFALQHRDADGAFTVETAPLHADGYAVVVPDVNAAIDRFGVSPLLGSGRLRASLRGATDPVVLALAPAASARRYLDGVAHAEVTSVGFASGPAPVTLVQAAGQRIPDPARNQDFWVGLSAQSLDWQPSDNPVSLLLLRADGKPGIDATIAVSRFPGWLRGATLGLLVSGLCGLLGGITLLFLAAEPVLVVEAHRMVEFADRIAERLEQTPPGESLAVVRRTRGLDLTGELVSVPPERPWHDGYNTAYGGGDDTSAADARGDVIGTAGADAERHRRRDRSTPSHRGRAPHTPAELADRWPPDEDGDDDGADGSPYVYTAT